MRDELEAESIIISSKHQQNHPLNQQRPITILIHPGHPPHNFLTMWESEVDSSPKELVRLATLSQ